jgi:hypothetical protein
VWRFASDGDVIWGFALARGVRGTGAVTPMLDTRDRFLELIDGLGPVSGRLALLAFAIGLATLVLLMIIMLST